MRANDEKFAHKETVIGSDIGDKFEAMEAAIKTLTTCDGFALVGVRRAGDDRVERSVVVYGESEMVVGGISELLSSHPELLPALLQHQTGLTSEELKQMSEELISAISAASKKKA